MSAVRWPPYRAVLLAVATHLTACTGADADPAARTFTVDTLPSGTVRVTNDGTGTWTPETAWRLEEDLRLGSAAEPGPELFSQIAAVTTDAEGRIFVLDAQTLEIRVFFPTGEFSHVIGGKGEGPGELAGGSGLNWGPDGSLWVFGGSGGYRVLRPEGEEVARHPRLVRNAVMPWSGGLLADGRYVDWGGAREQQRVQTEEHVSTIRTTGRTIYYPVAFTPPARLDTLPPLHYDHPVTDDGQLLAPAVTRTQRSLTLHVASDGIWFSLPDEYTVYKRAPEGDTLLAFSLPSRPMAVPPSVLDSVVAQGAGRPNSRSRDGYFSTLRLMMRILTDGAGRVWVFPQEEGVPEGTTVDVFEESGVHLGRMTVPAPIVVSGPVPHVTPEHLYAVQEDELGVHYLVRFRIVRP